MQNTHCTVHECTSAHTQYMSVHVHIHSTWVYRCTYTVHECTSVHTVHEYTQVHIQYMSVQVHIHSTHSTASTPSAATIQLCNTTIEKCTWSTGAWLHKRERRAYCLYSLQQEVVFQQFIRCRSFVRIRLKTTATDHTIDPFYMLLHLQNINKWWDTASSLPVSWSILPYKGTSMDMKTMK